MIILTVVTIVFMTVFIAMLKINDRTGTMND